MKSKIMKMIKSLIKSKSKTQSPIKSKSKTHRFLRPARMAEGNRDTLGLGVGLSAERAAAKSEAGHVTWIGPQVADPTRSTSPHRDFCLLT
jgi:hypothetical protein